MYLSKDVQNVQVTQIDHKYLKLDFS